MGESRMGWYARWNRRKGFEDGSRQPFRPIPFYNFRWLLHTYNNSYWGGFREGLKTLWNP